jgi:NAD(P)-dependent dehydrogenase (short-subunit alcohol dehydrogenase family)
VTSAADLVDRAMEATLVPSFTTIGPRVRSRLFGWTPSAELPTLDGKVVLVTGATSGLGEAAALDLARLGASVRLLARNPAKAADTERRVREESGNDDVRSGIADLSSLDAVRRFADEFLADHDRLDVLVHNAGALVHDFERTVDGIEVTVQTHVVAPFLLTQLLLPRLEAAGSARVLWVTSGGMYTERLSVDDLEMEPDGFDGTKAYARAKRAQVALVAEWARREAGVVFHAMHPGWADTPGIEESLPRFHRLVGPLLRSPAEGADTIVWLAAAEEPGKSSGALWLDRRPRATHRLRRTRRPDEAAEAARLFAWCESHV